MLGQKNADGSKAIGVFLVLCIALCSLAPPSLAQEDQQGSAPPVKLKSEGTAVALSLLGTLAPWGLLFMNTEGSLIGFLAAPFGPSLGYFYGGSASRGWTGIGIRTLGVAAIIVAFAAGEGSDNSGGAFLGVVGAGTIVVSTLYDLATVASAVRRRNLRVQGKHLAFMPVLSPRSKTVAIQVQFSF